MKQNTRFFTHTVAIWSLFIMGNAIINMPFKNSNEYTFSGLIAAGISGVFLYLITLPIAKKLFRDDCCKDKPLLIKILSGIAYLALLIFSLFCASDAFIDFVNFIKAIVLKDSSMFFIILIFLAVIFFFSLRRQEDILKFFLIAFWFVLAIVIFFFIATSFKFEFRNIFIFKLPELGELFEQSKPYILNPVIPSVLLPFYNVGVFKNPKIKSGMIGYILGCILLAVCVIGTVLLFGSNFSGILSYPYSMAISTVSIGRLFTRLDGFSYFVYFTTALAKITVCIFVAKISFKKIKNLFSTVKSR